MQDILGNVLKYLIQIESRSKSKRVDDILQPRKRPCSLCRFGDALQKQAVLDDHQEDNRVHPLAETETQTISLDEQTVEQLKAIGYLAGSENDRKRSEP